MPTLSDAVAQVKDKLYIYWKPVDPTEDMLEAFSSVFNDPDRFWKHFKDVIPEVICLNKVKKQDSCKFAFSKEQDSEFVWEYHDKDRWPYEAICRIIDDNLKYVVFWIRDNRTFCAWHGYMEVTKFSEEHPLG